MSTNATLTFKRELLLQALRQVKPGLASKDVVEQATRFVFNKGYVYTFNDDISVAYPVEHEIEAAIPAVEMYALLDKMKDVEVDISIDNSVMSIKGAKLSATIKSDESISMPLDNVTSPSQWFDVPPNLENIMSFVLLSVSTNLAQPVMTCVHWTDKVIESCDNFRLTRIKAPTEGMPPEGVLIPGSNIACLKDYAPVKYAIDESWVHFKTAEDCVLSCRVFSGEFVELDDLCDTPASDEIRFTDAMIELLDRVTVLAEKDVYNNSKAEVSIVKGIATVKTSNDLGGIEDRVRVKCPRDIAFNIKIETLKRILTYFKKAFLADNGSSLRFVNDDITHAISLKT